MINKLNRRLTRSACDLHQQIWYGPLPYCYPALKAGLCNCRYDPLSWEYPTWASINGPAVNILKGALVTSDRIVTVSEVRL